MDQHTIMEAGFSAGLVGDAGGDDPIFASRRLPLPGVVGAIGWSPPAAGADEEDCIAREK